VASITAALAWFDEAPEDLDRFVRALPGAVDRLVALDGGYERYPGAAASSPPAEKNAILEAAKDVGLPVIFGESRLWVGQLQKRNALIRLAGEDSDWIFTLDADHILHGVKEEFRHEVDRLRRFDRVDIEFYTTINHERPLAETSSTEWHSELAGKTYRMGLLMRVLPGMRYERFHWYISAVKDNRRVWVYGGDHKYPKIHSHQLRAPFFIEHRCHFRRDRNILANRDFCNDRDLIVDATGQEDAIAV
jgi:hypothetical protein